MPVFSPFNSSEKKQYPGLQEFEDEVNEFTAHLRSVGLGPNDESLDLDDDANFSDDTQGGGKPSAVETLL